MFAHTWLLIPSSWRGPLAGTRHVTLSHKVNDSNYKRVIKSRRRTFGSDSIEPISTLEKNLARKNLEHHGKSVDTEIRRAHTFKRFEATHCVIFQRKSRCSLVVKPEPGSLASDRLAVRPRQTRRSSYNGTGLSGRAEQSTAVTIMESSII